MRRAGAAHIELSIEDIVVDGVQRPDVDAFTAGFEREIAEGAVAYGASSEPATTVSSSTPIRITVPRGADGGSIGAEVARAIGARWSR